MLLTCVTAVFNAIKAGNHDRLVRCVESVARLQVPHEHLIYDGASTDGTVELLRKLEMVTPGLRVVSELDSGIYNALNKGVRDAKGEWFYVLGCDDYIARPEVLDGILKKENDRVDMYVGYVHVQDESGRFYVDDYFRRNIFWSMPYCHQSVIMKTACAREYGGFDEACRVSGDYSLIIQLHLHARHIVFFNDWFTVYASGGTSSRVVWGLSEASIVHRKSFHLTEREIQYFNERLAFPLLRIIPYVFHRDSTLRRASFYMLTRWVLGVIREVAKKFRRR